MFVKMICFSLCSLLNIENNLMEMLQNKNYFKFIDNFTKVSFIKYVQKRWKEICTLMYIVIIFCFILF